MNQGSVAPKERINISYRPSAESQIEKELPLKLLVLSELTPTNSTPIHERKVQRISKNNFDEVLARQNIRLEINVPSRINTNEENLAISFEPKQLKDFEPDQLIDSVPELKALKNLRTALVALKGPISNSKPFAKKLQNMLQDPQKRAQLIQDLGEPS